MKSTIEPHTLTSATYEELVREMIVRLGEDPDREGLVRTPARVEKAMQFLVKGYKEDPEALLRGALYTVSYDEMVIVKDVECSACASTTCCRFLARYMWPISRTEKSSA